MDDDEPGEGPGTDPAAEEGSPPETESDTDDVDESDTDDDCTFICDDDTPPIGECSVWDQDCPAGEKCMPWANDGGAAWNSTICTPVAGDPGQSGDECIVEGSGVSGIDTCDQSLICWNVDPETSIGQCLAMCTGSEQNPVCDDPSTACVIANDGVLILCLPQCDPLLQDCGDGQACYVSDDSFVCVPDASGPELGAYGDPCEFTNACDAGLLCAGAVAVPDCDSASCCTEFCDLGADEPDAMCSGQSDGQICISVFDEGSTPPGADDFGFCALPS